MDRFLSRTALSILLAVSLIPSCVLFAEEKEKPKAEEQKRTEAKPAESAEDKLFQGMKYRMIGPFRGGRSLAVSGVPGDLRTYWFGATGGGVWKSTDGALTWQPVFEKEGTSTIGALAVAPSDPNVVYVGTGEACIRGNISHGDGIYKTLDGGKTWKNVGLKDSRAFGRIVVHPRNPDMALAAALGHQFGSNPERGIFRTSDGGKTWEKVLYKDEKTGGVDLAMDPGNPNVLFASLWQAQRMPWAMSSGGPGSGLYRSGDGGATWKEIEGHGLPKKPYGRIGVAVAANSERVYALIEAEEGGLYRSDNGGETWQLVNANRRFRQRAWYYTHIFADPRDAATVYILNVNFFRSTDGGRTVNRIRTPHGDNHALWIDPLDTRRMIEGNDGGATVTLDGGRSWTRQDNQPTAQFYHVITDNQFPYRVYGSQQDNTTVGILSRSDRGVIDRPDWDPVGGGEAGHIAVDARDPNIVYGGEYQGHITRYDRRTGQVKEIGVFSELSDGKGAANLEHRFQWTAPILISSHDPSVLYHAGERLFRTSDGGMHWEAISPDLTRNDKSKQQASGGPITKDDTGTEYYDTIFAVAESPLEKGVIWAGTDDGLIHVTRDGGKNWANITPKEMPEWSRVSLIDASAHDAGTAYVAVDRHQLDDLKPYIYKTGDYGKSWTKRVTGIPEGSFVRAVREDPKRRGLLYAGTETGVYVSFDDGKNWRRLRLNLPTTPVHDLVVRGDDLVLATHGRSFWILDNVTPLRQFSEEAANAESHLYQPQAALRTQMNTSFFRPVLAGQNPPNGAFIDFYLKGEPKGEVALEILDAKGNRIRRLSSKVTPPVEVPLDPEDQRPKAELEVKPGLNRVVWDLRYERARRVSEYYLAEYRQGLLGPRVLPGSYTVRLTVDGASSTAPLEVRLDPRVQTSRAELEKQFDLLMQIRQQINRVYDALAQLRDVRLQVRGLRERLLSNAAMKTVLDQGEELERKCSAVEEDLIQTRIRADQDSLNWPMKLDGSLAHLALLISDGSDSAPTESQQRTFEKYKQQVDEQVGRWESLVANDLAAFQKLTAEQNIHGVVLMQPEVKAEGVRK